MWLHLSDKSHVRFNQCTENITDLENWMQAQDWFRDLSEQENSDKMNRMVAGRPRPPPPMTFEVDRASATLNERVAEIERMVHTRSAPPATTVESPTSHEELERLDTKIEAGFQAFSREVDELRENISQAIDGRHEDKKWARGKIIHVNTQLSGLREFRLLKDLFARSFPSKKAEPQL